MLNRTREITMTSTDTMTFGESMLAGCAYWEKRRVVYNLVLAALTLVLSLGEFLSMVGEPPYRAVGLVLVIGFFCLIANLCYCAAYIPEFILQLTPFRAAWSRYRWLLFASGTTLACIFVVVVLCYPHPM